MRAPILVLVLLVLLASSACRSERPIAEPPRLAEIHIIAEDPSVTLGEVAATVESMGGYVAKSDLWRDGDQLRARVTLRVPPEKLTSTLAAIRAEAKRVEHETICEAEKGSW